MQEPEISRPNAVSSATATTSKVRRSLFVAAQTILTVVLIYYAFRGVDLDAAWDKLSRLSSVSLLACFVVLLAQFFLLAWRWGVLLAHFSDLGRFGALLEGVLSERLLNQLIPTTVSGDATRVLALIRDGLRPGPAFQSVLFDRGAGLLGIAFLAGVTAPLMLLYTVNTFAVMVPVLLALGAAGAILAVALAPASLVDRLTSLTGSNRLSWLIITGQTMMRSRAFYIAVGLLSPLVHLMSCLVLVLIGVSISGWDSLTVYLMCAPAILLATAMPITLAGWGLRESTAVTLLTQFSIPASEALACSLVFGVVQLLTGVLAGLGLLILQAMRVARADAPEEPDNKGEAP